MTQSERATTRISAGFAGFINGLSENENAAMRALMLIGADQIGIDPTLVADDLRLTSGARLPPAVCDRLLAMLSQVNHDAAGSSGKGGLDLFRLELQRAFRHRRQRMNSSNRPSPWKHPTRLAASALILMKQSNEL